MTDQQKGNLIKFALVVFALTVIIIAVVITQQSPSTHSSSTSNKSSYSPPSYTSSYSSSSSSKPSSSSSSSNFTNAYGTATTKCAHPGCNNYIASSGDTNCCTTHSKKCMNCGKYIDEDAMFCISCLAEALGG